jgi:methyltransferase
MVALHASWLLALPIFLPRPPVIYAIPLALFLLVELCRVWVFVTLGPYFTTRVITLPGAPLVRTGPYRFVRHPNYVIVVGEILLLPLALGEPGVATVFSVLNLAMLAWRIRIEDAALAARR